MPSVIRFFERPGGTRRPLVDAMRIAAVVVVGAAVVLAVIDATQAGGIAWFKRHTWATQIASSVVVLLVTYQIVERLVDARQKRKWQYASQGPLVGFATGVRKILEDAAGFWIEPESGHGQWRHPSEAELRDSARMLDELGDDLQTMKSLLVATPELAMMLPALVHLEGAITVHRRKIRRALAGCSEGPPGRGHKPLLEAPYGWSIYVLRAYEDFAEESERFSGNPVFALTDTLRRFEPIRIALRRDR